jgi:hypothetical protein
MVEFSIFQLANRLTAISALILGSAWVTVSLGIVIGVIFLFMAGFVTIIIIEYLRHIDLERIRREGWGK